MTLEASSFTGTKLFSLFTKPTGHQDLRYLDNTESNTAPLFLRSITSPENSSRTKRNDFFFVPYFSISQLIDNYVSGEMDIPDIVRYLGAGWDESKVVLFLEQGNAKRPLSMQKLSTSDKNNLLNKLAYIRGTVEIQEYNSDEWIFREVVATQRIESIYVDPKN